MMMSDEVIETIIERVDKVLGGDRPFILILPKPTGRERGTQIETEIHFVVNKLTKEGLRAVAHIFLDSLNQET